MTYQELHARINRSRQGSWLARGTPRMLRNGQVQMGRFTTLCSVRNSIRVLVHGKLVMTFYPSGAIAIYPKTLVGAASTPLARERFLQLMPPLTVIDNTFGTLVLAPFLVARRRSRRMTLEYSTFRWEEAPRIWHLGWRCGVHRFYLWLSSSDGARRLCYVPELDDATSGPRWHRESYLSEWRSEQRRRQRERWEEEEAAAAVAAQRAARAVREAPPLQLPNEMYDMAVDREQ